MSITLCLTHDCNLRCAYCYAGRKRKEAMSRDTMRRALEWAVDYHRRNLPGKTFVLGFFGGEPLLEWDLLQEADSLAERLCDEIGLVLRRTVTTNCTLLSKPHADWLMERHYTLGGSRPCQELFERSMTMNETEDTAHSGTWAVEPPRKTGCGRKALRIALIVAAVGAAAAGAVVVYGRKIKEDFQSNIRGERK